MWGLSRGHLDWPAVRGVRGGPQGGGQPKPQGQCGQARPPQHRAARLTLWRAAPGLTPPWGPGGRQPEPQCPGPGHAPLPRASGRDRLSHRPGPALLGRGPCWPQPRLPGRARLRPHAGSLSCTPPSRATWTLVSEHRSTCALAGPAGARPGPVHGPAGLCPSPAALTRLHPLNRSYSPSTRL